MSSDIFGEPTFVANMFELACSLAATTFLPLQ